MAFFGFKSSKEVEEERPSFHRLWCAMQLENQRETMRIQRKEMQRASRLQTEQTFLGAHQANLNAGILNNATDTLPKGMTWSKVKKYFKGSPWSEEKPKK